MKIKHHLETIMQVKYFNNLLFKKVFIVFYVNKKAKEPVGSFAF